MKKLLTTLLAATMALTAVGGLVACGGDDTSGGGGGGGGDNNCVYYLAGASLGTAFDVEEGGETVSRDWYEKYMKPSEIPESIHFSQVSANNYALTVDLYKSDEFGILTAGQGWTDQIGGDKLDPVTDDRTAQISSQDNGVGGRNFHVGVSGNYTVKLNMTGGTPVVTYVRNGDPINAIHVDYDYFIKGDKVTAGTTMYVDYTKFKANDAKDEYTLEIGMQENDAFTFATIMEQDNAQKPERTSADFTLATDDKTKAAIELEKKPGEGENAEEKETGKFKIKGGTGTYVFKIKEDAEDKLTLSVEKKSDNVPAYDYYVVSPSKVEGASPFDFAYSQMTLNAETGAYEKNLDLAYDAKKGGDWVQVIAVAAGTEEVDTEKAKFVMTTAYASQEYFSDQVNMASDNWVVTASDTFNISIDPVSMIVTVKGQNDALTYNVELWGGMIKDWASAAASAEVKETKDDTPMTTTFYCTIEKDVEFQFRTNQKGSSNVIQYADGRITVNEEHPGTIHVDAEEFSYGAPDSLGNLKCLKTGMYKISVTIDTQGYVTDITIADVTYKVYLKGSYGNNPTWDLSKCVYNVANTTGTVEIVAELEKDAEFGFMTSDPADDKNTQIDWANGSGSLLNEKDFTVTDNTDNEWDKATGNFKVKTAGRYKFTVTVGANGAVKSIVAATTTDDVTVVPPAEGGEEA